MRIFQFPTLFFETLAPKIRLICCRLESALDAVDDIEDTLATETRSLMTLVVGRILALKVGYLSTMYPCLLMMCKLCVSFTASLQVKLEGENTGAEIWIGIHDSLEMLSGYLQNTRGSLTSEETSNLIAEIRPVLDCFTKHYMGSLQLQQQHMPDTSNSMGHGKSMMHPPP